MGLWRPFCMIAKKDHCKTEEGKGGFAPIIDWVDFRATDRVHFDFGGGGGGGKEKKKKK